MKKLTKTAILGFALIIVSLASWLSVAYGQNLTVMCHCVSPKIETVNVAVHEFEVQDFLTNLRQQGYSQFSLYAREDKETGEHLFDVTATKFLP